HDRRRAISGRDCGGGTEASVVDSTPADHAGASLLFGLFADRPPAVCRCGEGVRTDSDDASGACDGSGVAWAGRARTMLCASVRPIPWTKAVAAQPLAPHALAHSSH